MSEVRIGTRTALDRLGSASRAEEKPGAKVPGGDVARR